MPPHQNLTSHMLESLDQLTSTLGRIEDLKNAADLLAWDQETYMPEGGADARARQISTLQTLAHKRFTADEVGVLLEQAAETVQDLDPDSDAARLVQVARRDYERARKLPSELVAELAEAVSRAKEAWKQARQCDDFAHFAPHLKRIVGLNVQKAEALGYDDEPYDALLDEYEPGMKTAKVATLFRDLRADLVPIVEAIADQPPPGDDFLHQPFDTDRQRDFGEAVLEDIGYDFSRGRQDPSTHPFTTSFSINDVRLTTRYNEQFFPSAFFATLHEAGHGLYEQGIDPELERTPLADGTSLGMHESQSRLWENMVGRSRSFWTHYYPRLQATFPDALSNVSLEAFHRAINKVEPSLIRVEADEVTYNLHIMLRFELERALIQGTIHVDDLPELWHDTMEDYLGIRPASDAEGVLQDIHWSLGSIGYFPTYALGNLMSAQLHDQIQEDVPDLDRHLAAGQFDALLEWLRTHVHQHGRKFQAPELLQRITGHDLQADPWLRYIRTKYEALYGSIE